MHGWRQSSTDMLRWCALSAGTSSDSGHAGRRSGDGSSEGGGWLASAMCREKLGHVAGSCQQKDRWDCLSAEQQVEGQGRCLAVLLGCAQDPEWVVRYAAIAGVASLALAIAQSQPQMLSSLLKQLEERRSQEGVLAVKARILWAQQQVQGLTSMAAEGS